MFHLSKVAGDSSQGCAHRRRRRQLEAEETREQDKKVNVRME